MEGYEIYVKLELISPYGEVLDEAEVNLDVDDVIIGDLETAIDEMVDWAHQYEEEE